MNPFQAVANYGPDVSENFGVDSPPVRMPHIYALAQRAFKSMKFEGEDQSCVISGDSGSGKTETSKYFTGHLLDLSRAENTELLRKYDVLQFVASALLEAYGNSATTSNRNSSRFGKYVELQFNAEHHVASATVTHYLLEKSRVVHQNPNERNFHIFYYFLDGIDDRTLHACQLQRNGSKYAYLNGGITPAMQKAGGGAPNPIPYDQSSAMKFSLLWQQMQDVGFRQRDLDGVSSVLAVILHLGNLDFSETANNVQHYFDLSVSGPLDVLASLLSCNSEDLGNSLVTNIMVMRGETIILKNTVAAARDARDGIAKAL